MAFLDFIKNRQQQPSAEQSQQQKPETAREMYAREAQQDRSSAKPMDRISPDQRARVDAVKADLQKATQSLGRDAPPNAAAPAEGATSPQPMAQKMEGQDKAAPALSPTSMQTGTRATEENAPWAVTGKSIKDAGAFAGAAPNHGAADAVLGALMRPEVLAKIRLQRIEPGADGGGIFGGNGDALRMRHGGIEALDLPAGALDECQPFRIGHGASVFSEAKEGRCGHNSLARSKAFLVGLATGS